MKRYLEVLLLSVLVMSCSQEERLPQVPAQDGAGHEQSCGAYVEGEARVFLSEEMTAMIEEAAESGSVKTKSPEMNLVLEELGVTKMHRLFPHAGKYEPRTRAEGLHRWYVVKYSADIALTKAQASLGELPGVEMFEPVQKIKINDTFNDPSFSNLWGLNNSSKPGFDINVLPVWKNYTVGNADVIVSVVDNGIDLKHEDLAANCLTVGHYNAVYQNSNIVPGDHGTHVAGTIAAVGNNGRGVAGVAGGDKKNGKPGVKLMSCQIFVTTASGTEFKGSAAAIKWGADNGAVISQNSWGYDYDYNDDGEITGDEMKDALAARISSSDKAAVDYFVKYAGCDNSGNQLPDSPMRGGVVIFAAGNESLTNGAPAEYSEVIAVGSVTSSGTRSSFSNYGDWVDICAPGSDIWSTLPDNAYGKMSGTSMACPHVSGVAALIVSHFGGPGFTADMLKDKLLGSANKEVISQAYKIGGLVDAYGAFVYGNDKAPAAINDLTSKGYGNSIDFEWTMPADEDGIPAHGVMFVYGTDKASVEKASVTDMTGASYVICTPDAEAGAKASFTLSGLEFSKEYHIKAFAYSYGRNYSSATAVFTESTTANNPPVIELLYDGNFNILSSETLTVPMNISEPDGHDFTVTLKSANPSETLLQNPADKNWRFFVKGKDVEIGTYTSKVIAEDEYGMQTVLEIEYTIKDNSAPVKIKDIEDILLTSRGQSFTIDMDEYVYDPDGETLKYEAESSDSRVAHLNPKGNQIICSALGYGVVDVKVVAKDARGESVSFDFKVQVKDPSKPLTVYPNPVTDYVNVGTLDEAETTIRIYGATGKLMVEETSTVSGMSPARIDMRSCPPGSYTLVVEFSGSQYRQNIVKL